MKLRRYRELKPFKLEELAKAARITVAHASDLVRGERQPSLDVAIAIEKFTDGEVTCRDLQMPPSKKKPSARSAA